MLLLVFEYKKCGTREEILSSTFVTKRHEKENVSYIF